MLHSLHKFSLFMASKPQRLHQSNLLSVIRTSFIAVNYFSEITSFFFLLSQLQGPTLRAQQKGLEPWPHSHPLNPL